MKRSLSFRLVSLLVGATFPLAAGTDALAQTDCHHHGIPGGAGVPEAASAEGPSADPGQSHEGEHADGERHGHGYGPAEGGGAAHASEAGPASDRHEHEGPCTCMGTCLGGSQAPQLLASPGNAPSQDEAGVAAVFEDGAAEPRAPIPHLLPYANAPPASG